MELATLANIAEIVGACTIVSGMLFGLYQIRQHHEAQASAVASQLTQTFFRSDLANALAQLRHLPDSADPVLLQANNGELEEAAIIVTTSFETMGLLVYREIAELDLALDLAGGIMAVMWRKLHRWQEAVRIEQQQPSWAEWFEWLAVQANEHKGSHPPILATTRTAAPASPMQLLRAV